ncbi:F-box/kelch-repeat protein At3g06240-like [Bidens hawaiensis]|uniref:F-box/kelch-repeat protein At3g06240-like n=1 Tax=Bidens hawaiensis TaxID=980011 RepID=UPI00404B3813
MSNDVCNDLMVEIFERLPPKSIIRFRSLSKYWHARLLSPEFLHLHRLRCSKNPPKVIIRHVIGGKIHEYRDIYTLHSRDHLPLDPDSGFVGIPGVEFPYYLYPLRGLVIGSCNGILCLRNNTSITLWNFSVRRKLIVPRLSPSKTNFSKVALGFGFDPITDDYNIVAVSYNTSSAFIYSLKTDSWSAIPPPFARLSNSYSTKNACFFKGILHWVDSGYSTTRWTTFILTFNLSSHVFGYIWLPESWKVEQVTTINGCLAVVSPVYDQFLEKRYSWIRVMKEYGNTESWSALFKLKGIYGMTVFQPIINGDILAYSQNGSKVYNTQTKVTNFLRFGFGCCRVDMETYVESLKLVDKERATTCGKTVYSWTK